MFATRSRSCRHSAMRRSRHAWTSDTVLPSSPDRVVGGAGADARFPGVSIHESSYVDDPVTIGEGTRIWHFCHVLAQVKIGRDCSIGQNVVIGPNVVVGNGCK